MTQMRNICVTFLGAGRSGTSLSTRGLAAVGVDLGDRLRRGWGKNPTGFFEDRDLLALNQRLKHTLGIRGDSVRLIAAEEYDSPAIEALRHQAIHTIFDFDEGTERCDFGYGALDDLTNLVAVENRCPGIILSLLQSKADTRVRRIDLQNDRINLLAFR